MPDAEAMPPDHFAAEAIPLMQALKRTARRLMREPAEADDLVQETYLRALRSFHRYRPGTDIRGWLYTILYRTRTDELRRTSRRVRTVPLAEDSPVPAAASEPIRLASDDLARAVNRLPKAFRDAVVLRDVHDLSYQQIASVLSIPEGTVMSRIHRGRSLLRRDLERRRAS